MKKDGNNLYNKFNIKWVINISIITFILAMIFSIIAENIVLDLGIQLAFITLIIIIVIGIIFDIIGIAVTTAEEKPFHSMASNRIHEAKLAIKLVRNASQVSNFCNDVVGDICGIISGAVGTTLVLKIINHYGLSQGAILSTIGSALIASITVGGKAIGKSYAMLYHEKIIFRISKILSFLETSWGLDLFSIKRKRS